MHDAGAAYLSSWASFYVLIGSAAAALTGLQFVVMALVADLERRSSGGEVDAFATPNVVHFSAVLFAAALLSAPWATLMGLSILLMLSGAAGVVYLIIVVARMKRQTGYAAVLEDWIFHAYLPLVSYAILLASGALLRRYTVPALFGTAAASVLLLFIGIHNAWDTAAYLATQQHRARDDTSTP